MRVFLSGVMQGSRRDHLVCDQGYRERLAEVICAHTASVEIVDPWKLFPDSVDYGSDDARRTLLTVIALAGECDVVVAYAPEASMGTALEMWEAHRAHKRVLTISPMRANWVVAHISERVFDTLEDFEAFVRAGGLN